jgi:hypothetical protein
MRIRTLTRATAVLCLLAPLSVLGQSLGDAAAAESRRRAATRRTSNVSTQPAQQTTSTSTSNTSQSSSTSTRATNPASSTTSSNSPPVYTNQVLLEMRDQNLKRGTFSQGADTSQPDPASNGAADTPASTATTTVRDPGGSTTPGNPNNGGSRPPSPAPRPTPAPTPRATPTPVTRPSPTPSPTPTREDPAIPELERWQRQMVEFGRMACKALQSAGRTSEEKLALTYYDAARVYYQIADYTDDRSWLSCEAAAEGAYKDYVMKATGRVPGYWNFTTGLRMDLQNSSDSTSKQAVALLATRGAFCTDSTPLESTRDVAVSREVAYCLMAYLNAEAVGEPRRARMWQLADQALAHLDTWFVSKTSRAPRNGFDGPADAAGKYYLQPFMVGLTAQALIQYWDATKDPRVQPTIRRALDAIWDRAWVASDQSFWYENWVADPSKPFPPKPGAPDLNLLIAPAYAWMYYQSGDTRYRDRGDQAFAGGVKGAWLNGSKQFNQNYMWSFDYVRWRSD